MKNYVIFMLMLLTSLCKNKQSGPDVAIYDEETENGYEIYADNNEFCPVSVKIDFKLENMSVTNGNKQVYVLQANKKRQLLTRLAITDESKDSGFSYNYKSNLGDHTQQSYDKTFQYYLPFNTSTSFTVVQGYNGSFSHQNENALDFNMPVGTEITAIREGIVVDVVEKHTKRCGSAKCEKHNNYITMYHPDGTFADYLHIKQNGAAVKVGDRVSQGQRIGYSGNTGWSSGPHLHVEVFLQRSDKRKNLKTQFLTGNGATSEYLKEGLEYSRNY